MSTQRRAASRRPSIALRPAAEAVERRQLLTAMPFLTISNARVTEGTGTNSADVFVLKLTCPSAAPVSVDYATVDKTATAGQDYIAKAGTLVFEPGVTSMSVPVTVIGDAIPEPTETFGLALSNPRNVTLISALGMGSILDDDAPVDPKLAICDVTIKRGLDGSRTMLFNVCLNAAVGSTVTVNVATSNLTAVAGVDYAAASQTLTFDPGQTSRTFAVTIFGTATPSPDKIFFVKLSGANIAVADGSAVGILKFGA